MIEIQLMINSAKTKHSRVDEQTGLVDLNHPNYKPRNKSPSIYYYEETQ